MWEVIDSPLANTEKEEIELAMHTCVAESYYHDMAKRLAGAWAENSSGEFNREEADDIAAWFFGPEGKDYRT